MGQATGRKLGVHWATAWRGLERLLSGLLRRWVASDAAGSVRAWQAAFEPLESRVLLQGTVEGQIFDDLDGNGIRDFYDLAGDPGSPAASVVLKEAGSGTLIDTVAINPDGTFQISEVAAGDYWLEFPTLPDRDFSPQAASLSTGAVPTLDSDANPADGLTPVFTVGDDETVFQQAGYVPSGAFVVDTIFPGSTFEGSREALIGRFTDADGQVNEARIAWMDGTDTTLLAGDDGFTAPDTTPGPLQVTLDFTTLEQTALGGDPVNPFFDTQGKQDALAYAVDWVVSRINDTLAAVMPSGGDTWTPGLELPGVAGVNPVPLSEVGANELVFYAGGSSNLISEGGNPSLGILGQAEASGSDAWQDLVQSRGQPGALSEPASDVGPWGGGLLFDSTGNLPFVFDPMYAVGQSQVSFFTAAVRSTFQALGFGSAASWQRFVEPAMRSGPPAFAGPDVIAASDLDQPVALDFAGSLFGFNATIDKRQPLLSETYPVGERRLPTELDLAGLSDIGYELGGSRLGQIKADHVYADDTGVGSTQIPVGLFDAAEGLLDEVQIPVTVENADPVFVEPPQSVNLLLGQTLTLDPPVMFTDDGFGPDETFDFEIDWGDGTPVDTGTPSVVDGNEDQPTMGSITGSHAYSDDGVYTVTITVSDDDGGVSSTQITVDVQPSFEPSDVDALVFDDVDLDGSFNEGAGDTALADIELSLFFDGGPNNGELDGGDLRIDAASTDMSGVALFDFLASGSYLVVADEADPDLGGKVPVDDAVGSVFLPAGTSIIGPDIAFTDPITLSGRVFLDRNTDGLYQPDGEDGVASTADDELPLPGVKVFADFNFNGVADDGEPMLLTDANGLWQTDEAVPSIEDPKELIRHELPDGLGQVAPSALSFDEDTFDVMSPIIGPNVLQRGDFNGDGLNDLLSVSPDFDSLDVLPRQFDEDGGSELSFALPIDGGVGFGLTERSAVVGDLNQDGMDDAVAVAGSLPSRAKVYLGDAISTLSPRPDFDVFFTGNGGVQPQLADFDGDGYLDLAVLEPNDAGGLAVRLFKPNLGNDEFDLWQGFGTPVSAVLGQGDPSPDAIFFSVADITGQDTDGVSRPDPILVGVNDMSEPALSYLPNLGGDFADFGPSEGFTFSNQSGLNRLPVGPAIVEDLDLDGKPDVLLPIEDFDLGGAIIADPPAGNAAVAGEPPATAPLGGPGDLQDSVEGHKLAAFLPRPGATYDVNLVAGPFTSIHDVAVGHFDQGQRPDIAVAHDSSELSFFSGEIGPNWPLTFGTFLPMITGSEYRLLAADETFDGQTDLFVGDRLQSIIFSLLNATGGHLVDATTPGDVISDLDFANANPTEIRGTLFEDADSDGAFDGGEPTVGDVTVNLYRDVNLDGFLDAGDPLLDSTETDPSTGEYRFTGLEADNYLVLIEDTDPDLGELTLTGVNPVSIAAGPFELIIADVPLEAPTAEIAGQVWIDENGNDILDGDEVGQANVTVYVDLNDNGVFDGAAEPNALTLADLSETTDVDETGFYSIPDAPIGEELILRVVAPPQTTVGFPNDAKHVIAPLSPEQLAAPFDFGLIHQNASVGDFVFEDTNGNGIQDAGELGIENVTVRLFRDDGGMGVLEGQTATDSTGTYQFTNVAPDDYFLEIAPPTPPSGPDYQPTLLDVGGDDTVDNDAFDAMDPPGRIVSNVFTLDPAETDLTRDVGLVQAGEIVMELWDDANASGTRQLFEPGRSDATVELLDELGNPIDSTTPDAAGIARFTPLPGTYALRVIPSSGQRFSPPNIGDDSEDSDVAPLTGETGFFSLTSNGLVDEYDAGLFDPASVSGFAWEDENENGLFDTSPDEPPTAGVLVELLDNANTVLASVTTGSDGLYNFANLVPDDYRLRFTAPSGKLFTTPMAGDPTRDSDVIVGGDPAVGTVDFTLVSGQDLIDIDAGLVPEPVGVEINGEAWEDLNANGQRDAGEPPVVGAEISVRDIEDLLVGTATTDSDGLYSFPDLPEGTYTVTATPPLSSPFSFTVANIGDEASDSDFEFDGEAGTFFIEDGESLTLDAGFIQPGEILGQVFNDINGNGVFDPGEQAAVEPVIRLSDGESTVDTASFSDGGVFFFFDVSPGSYQLQIDLPDGFDMTDQDVGGNENLDSDFDPNTLATAFFNVGSGEEVTGLGAGLVAPPDPASVGDVVFHDLDGDGIQDAGEPGIENATVRLLDENLQELQNTTTDAAGGYGFSGLVPGDYALAFELPDPFVLTRDNAGGNDAVDSDAVSSGDPSVGQSGVFSLSQGQNDTTRDAGALIDASVGGEVFLDANGNDVQDPDEGPPPAVETYIVELLLDGDVFASTTPDSDGQYLFSGITPDDWELRILTPDGVQLVADNVGGDDDVDSDFRPADGRTGAFFIESGTLIDNLDAGVVIPTNRLGDFVFEDLNANGVQDASEPGVAGVDVDLIDVEGFEIASTQTDSSGLYEFASLPPGTYSVRFFLPADFEPTQANVGADDTVDSDATLISLGVAETDPFFLDFDEVDLTRDLGLIDVTPGSIEGTKFEDTNGNGSFDTGEPGVAGVTIYLDANDNGQLDGEEINTTTGTGGTYSFDDLPPDTYIVREVVPQGFQQTFPASGFHSVNLNSGQIADGIEFGNAPLIEPGSIEGTKWRDENGNGIRETDLISGETPDIVFVLDLSGSTSLLFQGTPVGDVNGDGSANSILDAEIAGFQALNQELIDRGLGDSAQVSIVIFADTARTVDVDPNVGGTLIAISPNADADGNGERDIEQTLADLNFGNANVGGGTNFEAPLQTALNVFDALDTAPGQGNLVFLSDGAGGGAFNDEVDQLNALDVNLNAFGVGAGASLPLLQQIEPDAAVFTSTDELLGIFSGDTGESVRFLEPGVAGIQIYLDANSNGQLDPGEPVTVTQNDDPDTDQDETGFYRFDDVAPGNYVVREVTPPGTVQTFPAGGAGHDVVLEPGQQLTGLNFGNQVEPFASVGNRVWEDLNDNGLQDPGEPGFTGIPVKLLEANGLTVASPATDAGGEYGFDEVDPGDYRLAFTAPDTHRFAAPNVGGDDSVDSDPNANGITGIFSLAAGQTDLTRDAGLVFVPPSSVHGSVFVDEDEDTERDEEEPPAEGVTVRLSDGEGGLLGEAITGPDGTYRFDEIREGTVTLSFVPLPGQTVTTPEGGVLDPIGLEPADTFVAPPTGITPPPPPAVIGGRVFDDVDRDGQQDEGEPGLPGRRVTLIDGDGDGLLTVTTGSNGAFAFGMLRPGVYQVSFAEAGRPLTRANVGDDDTDSDANSLTGLTPPVRVAPGDAITWDAGVASFGVISGLAQSTLDEAAVPGVVVTATADGLVQGTATTGPDGTYAIDELPPDVYTVAFTPPPEFTLITPPGGEIGGVDLTGLNTEATGLNANLEPPPPPAAIRGLAFIDLDGNGLFDSGEPVRQGVSVRLFDGEGNLPSLTATDANGEYAFTDLDPGSYEVRFAPPAGFTLTTPNAGDDTQDSDAALPLGSTGVISLVAGQTADHVDAGFVQLGSITGNAFNDLNANGTRQSGETGLDGITVQLSGPVSRPDAVTDRTGSYRFDDLPPGTYTVTFLPPQEFSLLSPPDGQIDLTLTSDDTLAMADAALQRLGSVGGRLFDDLNADGIRQDTDPGLAGIPVTLQDANGETLDTTTTDADGIYRFDNLLPGPYRVAFNPASVAADARLSPANVAANEARDSDFDPADPTQPIDVVLPPADLAPSIDAGVFLPASVGDFVFLDRDADGDQSGDAQGLGGVTVELFALPVADGENPTPLDSTVSDPDGFYRFDSLTPGDYRLRFRPDVTEALFSPMDAVDDEQDSDADPLTGLTDPFTLQSGQEDLTRDAGLRPPAPVQGRTTFDRDGDGQIDAADPVLPGVTVELINAGDNGLLDPDDPVVASDVTDDAGSYQLTPPLLSGTFFVRFMLPSGLTFTRPDAAGVDETRDSDADPLTGVAGPYFLDPQTPTQVDAGTVERFPALAMVGDTVFRDTNANGIQDPEEPGVPGVRVVLADALRQKVTATTQTDAAGRYLFRNVFPGAYVLGVELPEGVSFTEPDVGGDDAVDSDVAHEFGRTESFTLAAGEDRGNVDAGLVGSDQAFADQSDGSEQVVLLSAEIPLSDEPAVPPREAQDAELAGLNLGLEGIDLPQRGGVLTAAPGQWFRLTLRVTNTSDAPLRRLVQADLLAADGPQADPQSDPAIGQLTRYLALQPGQSVALPVYARLPHSVQPGAMNLVANLTVQELGSEADAAHGSAVAQDLLDVRWLAGREQRMAASVIDAEHTSSPLRLIVAGPGEAELQPVPNQPGRYDLQIRQTEAHSRVILLGSDAPTTALRHVTAEDPLAAFIAPHASLHGNLAANAGLLQVHLAAVSGATMSFAAHPSAAPMHLRLGQVAEASLNSEAPIHGLYVTDWQDHDGVPDRLIAPSFRVLHSLGDFRADVQAQRLEYLRVMRELSEAEVRVDQQIGTAVLGSMRTATLFAGVNDAVDPATLPASTADFASESGRIGRLILTGHAELSGAPFVDAHVAAWSIGMAKLHAEPANDGVDHGLTAHRFGALLTRVGDNPTPWTLRSLEEADGEQRLGNFLLQQVQNTP